MAQWCVEEAVIRLVDLDEAARLPAGTTSVAAHGFPAGRLGDPAYLEALAEAEAAARAFAAGGAG